MILLPGKRKIERRRDQLYHKLNMVITCGSVMQVEDIMRRIHIINLRLKTYFKGGISREPEEVFNDDSYDEEDTTEVEDTPTEKDIAQIEAEIEVRGIRD